MQPRTDCVDLRITPARKQLNSPLPPEQVAAEVGQQMFRLAGHASVLLLGGNNEVENSFDWFEQSCSNSSL
jgi:hypothetical protein